MTINRKAAILGPAIFDAEICKDGYTYSPGIRLSDGSYNTFRGPNCISNDPSWYTKSTVNEILSGMRWYDILNETQRDIIHKGLKQIIKDLP
jgi:hypothetical protein